MSERQMKQKIEHYKANHLERYLWAIRELKKRGAKTVLDAAAGTGYGSYMLANAGFDVHAVDLSQDAYAWHKTYFQHPNIVFSVGSVLNVQLNGYDAVVSIETIEHIKEDSEWVSRMQAPIIVATVPNQDVVPFDPEKYRFHVKHYTKDQFDALMPGKKQWFTQYGKWDNAKMVPGTDGMTLGVVCER